MRDYNKEAGAMLRTLRRQRQLTQCEAAHRLNTSGLSPPRTVEQFTCAMVQVLNTPRGPQDHRAPR